MNMQRRHFEFIAETIKEGPFTNMERGLVADIFARRLMVTNPNFNRPRFLKACGTEEYQSE